MSKKIIISLAIIAVVAVAVVGGTVAFFTDTETSTGNTFTAGTIDLKVDNTCHYNGKVCVAATGGGYVWQGTLEPCTCTWTLTDLTNQLFFNFADVKPGDSGEDTVSLHVDSNDSWVCAEIKNVISEENGCNDPEKEAEPACASSTVGELKDKVLFTVWRDNGTSTNSCNNVKDSDETAIMTDQPLGTGLIWPVADSSTGSALTGGLTTCIGISWKLATTVGNEVQSDKLGADVVFTAIQSRNNTSYLCPKPE